MDPKKGDKKMDSQISPQEGWDRCLLAKRLFSVVLLSGNQFSP